MLLSVVSGTYNRLEHLQRMMNSARQQIPRHIPYEFVIVDGGSTDGTLKWLESQKDTHLIRHGSLLGAIRAFCDGAKAAKGEYVVMANDDIEFQPYSILRALSHLESTPSCGAVAFADNRASKVEGGEGYRVLGMAAVDVNGNGTTVPYAQVGMFRRWLGDRVGWWGADDPIMSKARTYGGDNYLSSGIWQLGYSVDPVKGCIVEDHFDLVIDDLRTYDIEGHAQDGRQYYSCYPRGARLQPAPLLPNEQRERLRILVLPIYEPAYPGIKNLEYGLSEALAKAGLCWEIDYVNEPFDLPQAIALWQPDLLLTQIHHGHGEIRPEMLRRAREIKPDLVIVNWNGDAHEEGLLASDMLAVLREVDLQLVINAKVLETYAQKGIKADYWQIGYKDPVRPLPQIPAHDILFLGNCYDERRVQLVEILRTTGANVGIYGHCPDSNGNTHYDWAASRALYKNCKIAVGDTFPGTIGFVSNRFFQALAGGAFLLQEYSPGLDEYNGTKAGEHYVEWRDFEELAGLIPEWLAREEEREKIAGAGRDFIREHFSYDAQIKKLWGVL